MTEEKRLLLANICQEYFGISERVAMRKASMGLLPVPAFRLSGTKGAPWFVMQVDLEAHINHQHELSKPENIKARRAEEKTKPPKPTSLYRHFDSSGNLLYVGISVRVFSRISQHRTSSHWSEKITRIDVERFPSWDDAYQAETVAIQTEKPLHNRAKILK